jgi:hypothetical protein
MTKMFKTAIALIALAQVFSSAQENEGFRLGLYGTLAGGNDGLAGLLGEEGIGIVGTAGSIGVLFNIGNGLEFGLGLGISSVSRTTESTYDGETETAEYGVFLWEIIPSVSYEFGKKDFISYGAGLNFHLASYSIDRTYDNETVTTKPKNMDMAFFPNFFIKADVVKNFAVGLKTGLMINMPGDEEDEESEYYPGIGNITYKTTTKISIIDTRTEVFAAFYF